ncbi:unnamed protein product [Arabidopsis arenosa]|uniref:GFO/IDH/MocA-like oxidoreductase domain-containing protein n=1 Tax=Arabidopsis arenosa TaxID=38785 RepID=A0A8S2AK27_ARAAE|nr:unnamed protein product [Arabidopsis arenosa]
MSPDLTRRTAPPAKTDTLTRAEREGTTTTGNRSPLRCRKGKPERQNGALQTINSCFTFAGDEDFLKNDIRVKPGLDGLGALGDVGWYAIRATLFANNFGLSKTVTAFPDAILNELGVILSCGASLSWEDGRTATIYGSFLANLTMEITAIGTKGTLRVHDFVIPFQESEASFTTSTKSWFNDSVTAWVNPPSEHTVKTELPQEACMVREFARLVGEIKNNGAKPNGFWPSISRKTQLVVDAVKESIDKNYEQISFSGVVLCCVVKVRRQKTGCKISACSPLRETGGGVKLLQAAVSADPERLIWVISILVIEWLFEEASGHAGFVLHRSDGSVGCTVRFWLRIGTTKAGEPSLSDAAPLVLMLFGKVLHANQEVPIAWSCFDL